MTTIYCSHSEKNLPKSNGSEVSVLLYGNPSAARVGYVGATLRKTFIEKLPIVPSTNSLDFLTIALSVIAADTFLLRENAADAWCRDISLRIELANPTAWEDSKNDIQDALRFLSGDNWNLEFLSGGFSPKPEYFDKSKCDSVCLFSGGLDSAIGAVDLLANGRNPLLISHGYSKDQKIQELLFNRLSSYQPKWIMTNVNARRKPDEYGEGYIYETSMRARSLLFIALGVAAADSLSRRGNAGTRPTLYVPENGFISINPPLTPRRIGAHSTRTTHPAFLSAIQVILDKRGISVEIENPYRGMTKGEMLSGCADQKVIRHLAKSSVSCGKWKRKGKQCGRCVPCLIRRSAFQASGISDQTDTGYVTSSLASALKNENERDDVLAAMIAVKRMKAVNLNRWAMSNGPLPEDSVERELRTGAVSRGLKEIERFLRSQGCLP